MTIVVAVNLTMMLLRGHGIEAQADKLSQNLVCGCGDYSKRLMKADAVTREGEINAFLGHAGSRDGIIEPFLGHAARNTSRFWEHKTEIMITRKQIPLINPQFWPHLIL